MKTPVNVISEGSFRKIKEAKFKHFASEQIPLKLGELNFRGQFTTKMEANNQVTFANFFVREGNDDAAIINQKTAKRLKMI